MSAQRIGIGFDVHPLVPGRALVVGGVRIPYAKGLDGYSDADVVCHAIIDSLLGGAALGDIGAHFPSSDPQWAGASSIDLLSRVHRLVAARGYAPGNVDVTVVAQEPKISPYVSEMKEAIARALSMPKEDVSIKATTTDRLGFCGRGEGIAALAVSLLSPAQGSSE